jgi:uncharacterized membrane protein
VLSFIALVLSILVLAFSWNGIINTNTAEDKNLRRFWVLLGSSEILLAFICFAAIPELLYLSEIGNTALVIIFCVLSMGAILTACLYPNKE